MPDNDPPRSPPHVAARPSRAAIVAVDDDPPVLDALSADLRGHYGDRYRIVSAPSGQEALDVLERFKLRRTDVALLVVDQRMPRMTGTELLVRAKEIFPEAKSVLLTAYADTDAAISAINDVRLDHYVMKPWSPAEERLYPILDELLEEWSATRPPPDDALRVVGERWSPAAHRLRDYLARNLVPYRWLDLDDPASAPLVAAVPDGASYPLLVLGDGTTLSDPSPSEVARVLGLSSSLDVDFHDVVVIGAGPAGLAAAVYAGSEGLRTVVVEAEAPGGQAGLSSRIENYLGFPAGISGGELTRRAHAQARKFGTTFVAPRTAVGIRRADPYRVVVLDDGSELHCSAVIIATGVQYRRLDAPGVDELTGAGVYYGAASTEAAAMTGARVVVVGGANSAGQAALHLARFAREVMIVVRASTLGEGMSSYLVERIEATESISVRCDAVVAAVSGDGHLERVHVKGPNGDEAVDAAGMFVFIGAAPRTEWLSGDVACDPGGFIITGPALPPNRWPLERDPFLLETSIPAVFAVGDARARSIKRIASAVGEGSIAVQMVHAAIAAGQTPVAVSSRR